MSSPKLPRPDSSGDDDLDLVVEVGLAGPEAGQRGVGADVARSVGLDEVRVLLGPGEIGSLLVHARVDVVHHVAVLAVGGQDGVLVPGVDLVVGVGPGRSVPAEDAHLEVRIDLVCVSGQLEARIPGDVGRLRLPPHRGRVGPGRVVAVVAHLDLDLVHDGVLAAEQDLQQLGVLLRVLGLVVHEHRARAVRAQHAESLEGEAVDVARGDPVWSTPTATVAASAATTSEAADAGAAEVGSAPCKALRSSAAAVATPTPTRRRVGGQTPEPETLGAGAWEACMGLTPVVDDGNTQHSGNRSTMIRCTPSERGHVNPRPARCQYVRKCSHPSLA